MYVRVYLYNYNYIRFDLCAKFRAPPAATTHVLCALLSMQLNIKFQVECECESNCECDLPFGHENASSAALVWISSSSSAVDDSKAASQCELAAVGLVMLPI